MSIILGNTEPKTLHAHTGGPARDTLAKSAFKASGFPYTDELMTSFGFIITWGKFTGNAKPFNINLILYFEFSSEHFFVYYGLEDLNYDQFRKPKLYIKNELFKSSYKLYYNKDEIKKLNYILSVEVSKFMLAEINKSSSIESNL